MLGEIQRRLDSRERIYHDVRAVFQDLIDPGAEKSSGDALALKLAAVAHQSSNDFEILRVREQPLIHAEPHSSQAEQQHLQRFRARRISENDAVRMHDRLVSLRLASDLDTTSLEAQEVDGLGLDQRCCNPERG